MRVIANVLYSVALRNSVHSESTGQPEMNKIYSDPPPDEVLFKIFEYLDLPDLNNCEMVCRRWRDILLKNISWTKLLERMVTDEFLYTMQLKIS
jgi:F-box-like